MHDWISIYDHQKSNSHFPYYGRQLGSARLLPVSGVLLHDAVDCCWCRLFILWVSSCNTLTMFSVAHCIFSDFISLHCVFTSSTLCVFMRLSLQRDSLFHFFRSYSIRLFKGAPSRKRRTKEKQRRKTRRKERRRKEGNFAPNCWVSWFGVSCILLCSEYLILLS